MKAVWNGECDTYWGATGAFENVSAFIQMNFDGLKDDVINMLSGNPIDVDTSKFQNDMHVLNCKDDVLTLLVHLGYLAYDADRQQCYIPNREVAVEMKNAIEATGWTNLSKSHRELATGKGFADLVLIPRRGVSSPALVIELKYNHTAETAIDQIKRKNYPAKVAQYVGNLLLVAISYDKATKKHACKIETYTDKNVSG